MNTQKRQFSQAVYLLASLVLGMLFMSNAAPAQSVDIDALNVQGPLGDKVLGDPDAPVTMIEYASMTCGHCANFHNLTLPALKKKYIETGKVRFIVREFPFDTLALGVFMLARCHDQADYFETIDYYFKQQKRWLVRTNTLPALQKVSAEWGISEDEFKACLTNQQLLDAINLVKDRGVEKFGVNSTPTFFINGQMITGARPLEDFSKIIDPLLDKAS